MSDFKVSRIGLDDQRALQEIANQVKHQVPLFNGGDNGREAPLHTRRQFLKTGSGVVAVTFMPVWGTSAAGCEAVIAGVGLLITLFDVLKEVFNMLDPNDPIRGQMGFDNQTGGPLNLEAALDLLDLDRNSQADDNSVRLEIARDEQPVYEYAGLNAQNDGQHQTGVTALGETSNSAPFTVTRIA